MRTDPTIRDDEIRAIRSDAYPLRRAARNHAIVDTDVLDQRAAVEPELPGVARTRRRGCKRRAQGISRRRRH